MFSESKFASISSNIMKDDFFKWLMAKNMAKLAKLVSPLDSDSVPMVKCLFIGIAEKMIPY